MITRKPEFDRARAAARKLGGIFSEPPIPVLEIAEDNGVDVVFAGFGPNNDTVAGLCDFMNRKIYINRDDKRPRQMFTMAHELGHWMLHRAEFEEHPELYQIMPRFQQANRECPLEKEANAFAAELLVPKHLLDDVRNAPTAALADVFGVSRTMMEYRLKNAW